jgi:hypothetical protein
MVPRKMKKPAWGSGPFEIWTGEKRASRASDNPDNLEIADLRQVGNANFLQREAVP